MSFRYNSHGFWSMPMFSWKGREACIVVNYLNHISLHNKSCILISLLWCTANFINNFSYIMEISFYQWWNPAYQEKITNLQTGMKQLYRWYVLITMIVINNHCYNVILASYMKPVPLYTEYIMYYLALHI
jgi:hypothetical protein